VRILLQKTFVAVVGALALLAAAPAAHAKGVAENTTGCTPQPAFDHPFTAWGDMGAYTLSPGGDMETGLAGWTLSGSAAVVDGDDGLGVLAGAHVLSLPAGASVVTASICIDETYPHAKLVARSTVAEGSTLDVEVLYLDTKGKSVAKGSEHFQVKHGDWAPSAELGIDADLDGAAPVAFRLTAPKSSGWLLDDFYVDPRSRG
jgi:hypothetical protein